MNSVAHEVELDLAPERLPRVAWLAAGPPLITAGLIWWLVSYGSGLPWRDAGALRTTAYSLALWNMISLWIVCAALTLWYGMASSFTSRTTQLLAALAHQWANLVLLTAMKFALWMALPTSALILCIGAGIAAIAVMIYWRRRANKAIEANPVPFGYGVYFDSGDPAIAGRRGMNFASGWTWLLIVSGFLPGILTTWLLK